MIDTHIYYGQVEKRQKRQAYLLAKAAQNSIIQVEGGDYPVYQPNDQERFRKIEERIDKLEEDRDGMIESEKLLLKMARLHRIGLQELRASIEVDIGDLRERLDAVERKVNAVERKVDAVERKVDAVERKVDKIEVTLKAVQSEQTKRFDQLETVMLQILDRLPQSPGE
jgi:phage shock protein A